MKPDSTPHEQQLLARLDDGDEAATSAAARLLEIWEPPTFAAALERVSATRPLTDHLQQVMRSAWTIYHHERDRSWN